MEYTGLYIKYPINRALTEQEREQQLKQKERLEIEPAYQLSVIKLNSTYMEMVDKYFAWKGVVTGFAFGIFAVFFPTVVSSVIDLLMQGSNGARLLNQQGNLWWELVFVALFLTVVAVPTVWMLRKESFAYTHYPMRFNRKTRMVHVFRLDGTVLSVPWDEVFFCLGSLRQGSWEIQGHVLDHDGLTIKETFCAFPQIGGSQTEREQLKVHWEFIRRYMEEGPQDAYQRAEICLPIASQRERVSFGFHRMHTEGTGNLIPQLMAATMALVILPGRWFAMQTSKIPQWPAEIEALNQVEAGDRFVRDASMNPKWREMPDAVWLGISAAIWAALIYWVSGLEPWR